MSGVEAAAGHAETVHLVEVVQVHRRHKHRKAEEQQSQLALVEGDVDPEKKLGHHTAQRQAEAGE